MIALFVVVLTGLEWLKWLTNADHSPIVMTCFAAVIIAIAIKKSRTVANQIRHLKLGLKGERAVGQLLQSQLLPLGYLVLHDICIDDFNLDHVLVGPGGVFAVEVKTRSKPIRGDVRVQYDGILVKVNGRTPDRNPIAQAQAGAARLEEILTNYTGHTTKVRPVVLFPGWYVERQSPGVRVWVLNEKAFVKFVEKETEQLSKPEIRMFSEALARYVRDQMA